jgi:hypothetical protein
MSESIPYEGVPRTLGQAPEKEHIVNVLTSYKREAVENRQGGPNGRDAKWDENLDLYWNRHDFSGKAAWQAKETMPEVPAFVDRFSAAMKEALVAAPGGFYTVTDPADKEHDVTDAIKSMMDTWLSVSGRNPQGTPLGFPAVFEEQMQMGSIMACGAVVTWKHDHGDGRVSIEAVDPRNIWLDHTHRGLYRIRQVELDKHDLMEMARTTNKKGENVFDVDQISQLVSHVSQTERAEREAASGHGQAVVTGRTPIKLDEYLATVLDEEGKVIANKGLFVIANDQFLIRGPTPNPFWHKKDWLLYAPLSMAPLSVYGRSYMEDFGGLARTFNSLTNLILDAVNTSALNAFAVVPSMLKNPAQLNEGISPNKIFLLEEGFNAGDFAEQIQLGQLNRGAVEIWQNMKSELAEAAGINEIGLGQFAPNSRTSATEINQTQQSASAIVRSVAQTVESRFLNPLLDLTWKTGLQHVKAGDKAISDAVGEEMFSALIRHRKELIQRPITFQAGGISALIQKSQMLEKMLGVLQIVTMNDNLLAAFAQVVDMQKFLRLIFTLSNVDFASLAATPREQLIRSIATPLMERAGQGEATEGGLEEMGEMANIMGIGQ